MLILRISGCAWGELLRGKFDRRKEVGCCWRTRLIKDAADDLDKFELEEMEVEQGVVVKNLRLQSRQLRRSVEESVSKRFASLLGSY